ncbi:MAG: 30S ribosomal protein S20 [Thermoleophilia bacterium]
MANTAQQRKRIRIAQRQRLENLRYKSAIKTHFRRLRAAVDQGDSETARQVATKLTSTIDKAAARKAIHKNNAARKKSHVDGLLHRLTSAE